MLAFVDLEARVPPDHPLRIIKAVADHGLVALSPEFNRVYAEVGRPSIPPERLLKIFVGSSLFTRCGMSAPSVRVWTIPKSRDCSAGSWT